MNLTKMREKLFFNNNIDFIFTILKKAFVAHSLQSYSRWAT